jgi:hypothetical protein
MKKNVLLIISYLLMMFIIWFGLFVLSNPLLVFIETGIYIFILLKAFVDNATILLDTLDLVEEVLNKFVKVSKEKIDISIKYYDLLKQVEKGE